MLGTLFSYDFRALSRILVPVHLVAIGLAVVAFAAGAAWSVRFQSDVASGFGHIDDVAFMYYGLLVTVIGMCSLLVSVAPAATIIVALQRYYAHFFTDEGHLTFTLPATAGQHLASKLFASLAWIVIDFVVVVLCATFVIWGVVGFDGYLALDGVGWFLAVLGNGSLFFDADAGAAAWGWSAVGLLFCIASAFSMFLTAVLAFTIAAAVARRHRVIAGIGLYLGISCGVSFVSGMVSLVIMSLPLSMPSEGSYASTLFDGSATIAVSWVVSVAVIVVGALVSRALLATKVDAA